MELSPHRIVNLSKRLNLRLAQEQIRPPKSSETEPAYTREVLSLVVKIELSNLPGLALRFRGDGGSAQAIPASVLGIPFFPDMAVTIGEQNLWAAEVKILRATNRQNAIATAIGQATIYRSRYEHVAVILIDTSPSSQVNQKALVREVGELGLNLVIRPRVGKTLLPQSDN